MTDEAITLVVDFAIKPGQADAFVAASEAMRATVDENEPGTLRYDWYVDADRSHGVNIEIFRDSDALVTHMAGTADFIDDLMAAADVASLDVLGDPSAVGRESIADAATGWFTKLGGVRR